MTDNKRAMRTVDQDYAHFKDFKDIAPNLVDWHGVYLAKLHYGEHLVIKLKEDSENEEFPYIIEAVPMTQRFPMGDIALNFETVYDRDPTIQELTLLNEKLKGFFGKMDYSDQNDQIADKIREIADEGLLPDYPKWWLE